MSVYLDYNSTTSVDPRVMECMRPWFTEKFGNTASADHAWGWDAAEAVEAARAQVAELIGAASHEIVFTSSATEGIQTVLHSYLGLPGARIGAGATEHEAVVGLLERRAAESPANIEWLPVDRGGRLEAATVAAVVDRTSCALLCLMLANNETGVCHPVQACAEITRARGVKVLCDLTQAAGKIPVDVRVLGVDFAALSGHKIYGPKGVGALFVRGGFRDSGLMPLLVGDQERGARAGTSNVPGIVGLGEAARIAGHELTAEAARNTVLRDRLEAEILRELPDTWINGDRKHRLPNTASLGFDGLTGRELIREVRDIALSTRAACSSAAQKPSHVLKAMGCSDDQAYGSVRFSLGRFTTDDEIAYAIEKVISAARRLRSRTACA